MKMSKFYNCPNCDQQMLNIALNYSSCWNCNIYFSPFMIGSNKIKQVLIVNDKEFVEGDFEYCSKYYKKTIKGKLKAFI